VTEETTRDAIFGGRVALRQPARARGYRVNVDALLLASFASAGPRRARRAFDLGAGVGAVGLGLLHLGGAEHVTMIERDPALAALAEENAASNGWSARASVIAADVAEVARAGSGDGARARAATARRTGDDGRAGAPGSADLVVCNPPYVAPGRGRAPSAARAAARSGSLDAFLDAARRLAGRRARVCFVYPAREATTLLGELRRRGLEPKRLRAVHGRARDAARVVLVECAAGRPGGLAIEPPLVETDDRGRPSTEIARLVAPSNEAS
jgi:tRNA1Val (adenine37-N6)-methyltransferase